MGELSSITRVARPPPRSTHRRRGLAAIATRDALSVERDRFPPRPQRYAGGESIYAHDTPGTAWRLISGSVRLDRVEPKGEQSFANLAIKGDIIGAETLLCGLYTFSATALSACLLEPWPAGSGTPSGESLLHAMARTEYRTSETMALRCGQAAERVRRLVSLLASAGEENAYGGDRRLQIYHVALPPRQDMADITALTLETVSRMVSGLRHAGILKPLQGADGASTLYFGAHAMSRAKGTGN